MQPHQKHSFSVRSATFHASLLVHKQTFLDPSGLCCIATEKIWWLLTKFIINNHLTVEEKICHRK
ncbi:hypothetical protein [Wolbachia endosymbiont (group A) of Rhinocyllus conicus]|uniref:hypothetical protein n=1 Tax=Wolbachia endosymbiont (group A) of Rhinocyllus conicus TaxID=2954053 RepID=UPI0022269397|nr:hypothetical protein [Wolbachia endosymbiont (group A) of Rhinocyllus conicus]